MGLRTDPTERQRRFGEELRRLRIAAGMSAPEAGARIGIKGPAVSHTEAGRLGLNPERLNTWLDACDCTDPALRSALVAMSQSSGKGWWTAYRDLVHPSALDLAEHEAGAVSLDSYETLLIPGLLQIPEYAGVILETAAETEERLRFRIERQAILHGETPPRLHAVIHEAALHMRYGGVAVMEKQLLHLLRMSELPHVTIQIFPFSRTEYASTDTTFMMLGARHPRLDTVLMEHPAGSAYLGEPEAVDKYRHTFAELTRLALPRVETSRAARPHTGRDSWGLIQHVLYTLH